MNKDRVLTVGELIKKLNKFDPENIIFLVDNNNGDCKPLLKGTDIIPVEYGFNGEPDKGKVLLVLPFVKDFQ